MGVFLYGGEMPSTKVDICNMALDHLHVAPITSIDAPTTKEERIVSRWYDNTRRAVLRMHTWNFAIKSTTITALVSPPDIDWSHQYNLPADYIRIVRIGDKFCPIRHYDIQDDKLLINAEGPLQVRYVFDNTTIADYEPLFIETLALDLAVNLAFPLTGNLQILNNLKALRDEKRMMAYHVDGQERPPRRRERSRFKRARMFGRTGRRDLEGNEDW